MIQHQDLIGWLLACLCLLVVSPLFERVQREADAWKREWRGRR